MSTSATNEIVVHRALDSDPSKPGKQFPFGLIKVTIGGIDITELVMVQSVTHTSGNGMFPETTIVIAGSPYREVDASPERKGS